MIVSIKTARAISFFSLRTSFTEKKIPAQVISKLPKNFITEERLLFLILFMHK